MGQTLSDRGRFREAGRRVLRTPEDGPTHLERARRAGALDGAEPLQGALADMLVACAPDAPALEQALAEPAARGRLAPFVVEALRAQVRSGKRLPRVNTLATRWSVLAMPSLDVPPRALLCSVDDSRAVASAALAPMLAGDHAAEQAFLTHCVGANDTLAFMLARRELTRQGRAMSPAWDKAMQTLQSGVHG